MRFDYVNGALFVSVWIGLILIFPTEDKKPLIVSEVIKETYSICKHESQNAAQLALCADSNRRAKKYYGVSEK